MSNPPDVTDRPLVGGSVVPFACVDDDGHAAHERVVKSRAIRSALSRICGICGQVLTRPVAFVGTPDEVMDGEFLFPPCHETCVREAAADARQLLGHERRPRRWVLVTTGGFDLIRPERRGGPVSFKPNSVLQRETLVEQESAPHS